MHQLDNIRYQKPPQKFMTIAIFLIEYLFIVKQENTGHNKIKTFLSTI